MRLILLGNAGSGKTTMARRLTHDRDLPILSLDAIAWARGPTRTPFEDSAREVLEFVGSNDAWIIEGCYGDLVRVALPFCSELRFLNPGMAACLEHCARRPWEPDKFTSREAQDAVLEGLLAWVREYETRDDEYGLRCHREIFDGFTGTKREHTSVSSYPDG